MNRRSVMIVFCFGLFLLLSSACSSGEGIVESPAEGKSSAGKFHAGIRSPAGIG